MSKYLENLIERVYPSFEGLFSDKEEDKNGASLTKVLLTVLVYAAIAGIILFVFDIVLMNFTDKGGVFADFFGGILNPILTFLTFFALIATIVIQRHELRLARIEYEKTADALSTQAVEMTFFNILDLHHKIVDNIKVDLNELKERSLAESVLREVANISIGVSASERTVFEGRGVFEEILNFISYGTSSPDQVVERYRLMQSKNNHVLGHYFRNLYQALKVIDSYDETILPKKASINTRAF